MTTTLSNVRAFAPSDLERYVEVANAAYPEYGWTVDEVRHEDENWDHAKYFKARLVAEEDGEVVGVGEAAHDRYHFVPDTYWIDVTVDPARRGRGHGTALWTALLAILTERRAKRLRDAVKESMAEGVRFAERLGLREMKRDWESRLDVRAFDEAPFASSFTRIAEQGIRITTLASELAKDRDAALRTAFELREDLRRDVPSLDPASPTDLELFVKGSIDSPTALHDAYFIAVGRDGRWLGNSDLWASLNDPSFLWQGLTGVRREARGKGVAMALKLMTVRYAKEHGKREIKTWNDTQNRAMLRINEALGFVKQPAWIRYQKDLAGT
ncbi:MAG TPA: GNAT family N-acetyltransferase [Candidatus Limnocylindria bacterium]|nr:GNAT family N-acetyltransferase [Candidatus Limnocylindria bacterium]